MLYHFDALSPALRCQFHRIPIGKTQHILHRPLTEQAADQEPFIVSDAMRHKKRFPQPDQVLIGAVTPKVTHEYFQPCRRETLSDIVFAMVLTFWRVRKVVSLCVSHGPVISQYPALYDFCAVQRSSVRYAGYLLWHNATVPYFRRCANSNSIKHLLHRLFTPDRPDFSRRRIYACPDPRRTQFKTTLRDALCCFLRNRFHRPV